MNRRLSSLLELTLFYGLIFSVIWIGQKLPWRPPLIVAGVALLGACALSNKWHGDSWEDIGLARRHFKPCLELVLKVFAVPFLVLFFFAVQQPPLPWPKLLFGILGYPLWAFAQEYALQSFCANRLKDIGGERPWALACLNGLLFSLVHFPNPVLLVFCFVGGTLFTRVFLKTPHLAPLALAHAWSGFLLSVIFQKFTPILMIGPSYIKHFGFDGPWR